MIDLTYPDFRRKVIDMGKQVTLRKRRVVALTKKRRDEELYPVLRGSAGSVLLVIIITMVILASLTAALLPTLFTTEMGQVSASGAMKAYYLAEAGGRYALPRLASIADGTHTFKFFSGGGTFFQIEKISNTQFTSTGIVSEGTNLEARVVITYRLNGTFDYGLFGSDGITIGNNADVVGPVGTNSDNPDDISGEEYVTGPEPEFSADKDMAPMDLPAGAALWPPPPDNLDMSSNNRTVNLDGSDGGYYYAETIDISNNSIVNITGNVTIYVSGTTTASNNSTININSGASLTIYAGDDINLSNNSINNPDQTPADFIIYGLAGCDSIDLSNNSDTYAAIYAPTAEITLGNNGIFHGSLVGETITIGNNAAIYYDESLQGVGSGSGGGVVEQYFTPN